MYNFIFFKRKHKKSIVKLELLDEDILPKTKNKTRLEFTILYL